MHGLFIGYDIDNVADIAFKCFTYADQNIHRY